MTDAPSSNDFPPYERGRIAYTSGQPESANPFPKPEKPVTGDDYPGARQNWLEGWRLERDLWAYTEALARAARMR